MSVMPGFRSPWWTAWLVVAYACFLLPAVTTTAIGDEPAAPSAEVLTNATDTPPEATHKEHAQQDNAHENPYDLSHANAGPQQRNIVELKADMALFSFIVFLLLLAVVTKFAWKPIMGGLEKREHGIAAMIDEARASAEKAQASLAQYEAKLAAAAEETREMLAQARKDAEVAKEKIIAEAQAAAHRERDKSLADIRAAKEAALREMAQKSVDSAFALASRIIHKEIKAGDHAALIQDSLSNFPSQN
jgi:F-type H+-transporting ATPase subunit b